MKNKKTIKKILIGLIIAIAVLILYSLFSSSGNKNFVSLNNGLSSTSGSSSVGQINENDTTVANAEIIKILGSIEHIELHDDIFTNPVFRKLKDTNFAIPRPSIIGRKNPFLPIGFNTIDDLEQLNTEGDINPDQNNQSDNFFSDINENLN